jgi:hypothetical protein
MPDRPDSFRAARAALALALAGVLCLGAGWVLAAWTRPGSPARGEVEPPRVTAGAAAVGPSTPPLAQVDLAQPPHVPAAPDTATAPQRAAGTGSITVLAPSGRPLAGAAVVHFDGNEVLATARTADDGVAPIGPATTRGEVAVWLPDHPPFRVVLDDVPDGTVRLPRGASLAGRVILDHEVPRHAIALQLEHTAELGIQRFPTAVRAALGMPTEAYGAVVVRTRDDGTFRFDGLPEDWFGTLRWSTGYLEDANVQSDVQALELTRPPEHLVLRLAREVAMRVRVVGTSGAPIPFAWISTENGGSRTSGRGAAVLSLRRPLPDELLVDLQREALGEVFGAQVAVAVPRRAMEEWDAGDVVLVAPPELPLRLVDADGRGVPGRVEVVAQGDEALSSFSAHPDGRVAVPITPGVVALRTSAPGYLPARVMAPFDVRRELVVELRGAAAATLRLVVDPPASRKVLWASLLPAGALEEPLEAGDWTHAWSARPFRAGGTVAFPEVAPGVPLVARVHDAAGGTLLAEGVASIDAGETRAIALELRWSPATFYLRVRDASGAPAHGATILLDGRAVASTDRLGEAELAGVAPGRVELRVRHPEHAELVESGFAIPAEGAWVELALP